MTTQRKRKKKWWLWTIPAVVLIALVAIVAVARGSGSKIDPSKLPDSVVCYVDSTVALPLITAYAMARRKPRAPRRLYEHRERLMAELTTAYEVVRKQRLKKGQS